MSARHIGKLLENGKACEGAHNGNKLTSQLLIVKFLQDKKKYCKRRAKISADISARLFKVTCKVSSTQIHRIES